ncbi:hypothetical protein D3C87_504720 [compost metagenome]
MTQTTQDYWHNFTELKDVVSKIEQMAEPNVDQLVVLVERGLSAQKACLSRIEEVERMLSGMHQENQ